MKLHPDSHLDHGLSWAQTSYLLERFGDHSVPFAATIELPESLGTVPCSLVGPVAGDAPVREDQVSYQTRGTRTWRSRMIAMPARRSRQVTVVAGAHDGHPCVLFTAYGGPAAPQEPDDPGCRDVEASRAFWREHALIQG